MSSVRFHLRYTLSRRDRWFILRQRFPTGLLLISNALPCFFLVRMTMAWAHGEIYEGVCWADMSVLLLFLGLIFPVLGTLHILLKPAEHWDIQVGEEAAGILLGKQRWMLPLDGITAIEKRGPFHFIRHWNGWKLHIPDHAITPDQLAFLHQAMKNGQTPEGTQRAIGRGRKLQALLHKK